MLKDFDDSYQSILNNLKIFLYQFGSKRKEEATLFAGLLLYLQKHQSLKISPKDTIKDNLDSLIIIASISDETFDSYLYCDKKFVYSISNESLRKTLLKTINELRSIVKNKIGVFTFASAIINADIKDTDFGSIFQLILNELPDIIDYTYIQPPKELSLLITYLIDDKAGDILNPFGGYIDFRNTTADQKFCIYKKSEEKKLLDYFKLSLNNRLDNVELFENNKECTIEKYDSIVASTLLSNNNLNQSEIEIVETLIKTFEKHSNDSGQLIIIVADSFLQSKSSDIRKKVVMNNWLDMIIALPSFIYDKTELTIKSNSKKSAILVLKKNRKESDLIHFIDASTNVIKSKYGDILDSNAIINLIDNPQNGNCLSVKRYNGFETDSWQVGAMAYKNKISKISSEDFETVRFFDVLEGLSGILNKDVSQKGRIFREFSASLINYELKQTELPIDVSGNRVRIVEPFIVISPDKYPFYCFASEEEPIFALFEESLCFYKIKNSTIHIGYLCLELFKKISLLKEYLDITYRSDISLNLWLSLPALKDKDSYNEQERLYDIAKKDYQLTSSEELNLQEIIDSKKEDYKKEIRVRKHAMSQDTSLLAVNLSILKDFIEEHSGKVINVEDRIGISQSMSLSELLETITNSAEAIERQTVHLADDDTDWGKVDDINLYWFIDDYINTHKTPLFSYIFDIQKEKNTECSILESIIRMPNKALCQVFNNIISNAISHGFDENKDHHIYFNCYNDGNTVILEISNDGTPLDNGVDTNFIKSYGCSTKINQKSANDSHSGIGGHQIYNILKQYGAEYDIISTPKETRTVTYRIKFNK